MKLSIIIPAFNEEKRISRTLRNTISYLGSQEYESEIIVVCDGNTDKTHLVAENFKTGGKISLKVLRYSENKGKGYAVQYGMLQGKGHYLMFMDADYAVPIKEVEKGLQLIKEGADIAIASRAIIGSVINAPQNIFRTLSAKIYTFVQNIYLGIHFKDTQCGFKIFRRKVARELFTKQKLTSVIFDPEILWLASLSGYTVAEFPITWSHIEDSQIVYDSFKKSLFVFEELLSIKKLHKE